MISVSDKNWTERKVNKNSIEKIKQDYGFNEILSKLIVSRNFNISEIYSIDNDLFFTNEFINNNDFDKGSDLLIDSINKKENIYILGDYDVDGSASTSLLVRFFKHIKHPYFYYIPDREKDGYGATVKLFKELIIKKPKLVILLDCGSTSYDAINFLNENNIKSIIIDHHEIHKPFPKSDVTINPKKNNGYIKYDYLCSTTLTYFFLDIVIKKIKSDFEIQDFLIYVVLATICDVMPLRNLNRLIIQNVINTFDIKNNIAFNSLFKLAKKKNKLSINDLGFFIGPILNSGGRLGKSILATKLLSSDDLFEVNDISNQLIKLNDKRKIIESLLLSEINFDKIKDLNENVIIYYNPNLNEGLIGIIAARLNDYFEKPAIVITKSKSLLKASARSTAFYNIGHLVRELKIKNFIVNGGGHNMAAGFTLKEDKLKLMKDYILEDFSKKNLKFKIKKFYESEISSSAFNNVFKDLNKLNPFGNGNPLPIFLIKDLTIIKSSILNNKHISVIFKSKSRSYIKSISFNSLNTEIGRYLLSYKKNLHVLAHIQENFWNNKKSLQLNIIDILIY